MLCPRAASARSAPNTVRGDWTSPGLATPVDESAPKYEELAGCVLLLLQHHYTYCFPVYLLNGMLLLPLCRFSKTVSGVKVQELGLGKGREAHANSRVEVDFVLRRPNGYFIYSTVQGVSFQPKDVPIGPLDLNLVGARVKVLLVQTGQMQVLEGVLVLPETQCHELCCLALHVIVLRQFYVAE